MNKWLRAVCVGAAAAAMLTASAFAANYTNCADSLHEMGLFQGTQNGYDLDRTPTRAEAAVMLVRLLGKEAEAKALTYTAPFTDLKGWEKPYVQYLYSNGLANGNSFVSLPLYFGLLFNFFRYIFAFAVFILRGMAAASPYGLSLIHISYSPTFRNSTLNGP